MNIGLLIKEYRQSNNLTLRDFANKCGTSHSYIAMLENNKNSKTGEPMIPTIAMMKKLSVGMGISVNDLISICDDMPINLNSNVDMKIDLQLFANKNPTVLNDGISEKRKALIEWAMKVPEEKADRVLQALKLIVGDD